jgi:hypothetical protein
MAGRRWRIDGAFAAGRAGLNRTLCLARCWPKQALPALPSPVQAG